MLGSKLIHLVKRVQGFPFAPKLITCFANYGHSPVANAQLEFTRLLHMQLYLCTQSYIYVSRCLFVYICVPKCLWSLPYVNYEMFMGIVNVWVDSISPLFISLGSFRQWSSFSNNGLDLLSWISCLNRRQAIMWTSDGLVTDAHMSYSYSNVRKCS